MIDDVHSSARAQQAADVRHSVSLEPFYPQHQFGAAVQPGAARTTKAAAAPPPPLVFFSALPDPAHKQRRAAETMPVRA